MGQVGTERLPLWQLLLCHAHTLCSPDQRRLGCVSFNSDKLRLTIFDQHLFQHTPRFNVVNLWGPRTNPVVQNWALNILHCLLRCLSLLLCQHLCCLDHRHLQRAGRGRAWGRHGQEPEILHWFCHPGPNRALTLMVLFLIILVFVAFSFINESFTGKAVGIVCSYWDDRNQVRSDSLGSNILITRAFLFTHHSKLSVVGKAGNLKTNTFLNFQKEKQWHWFSCNKECYDDTNQGNVK